MTKIFLDSGDPAETVEALKLLGSLDGQTTNPSLGRNLVTVSFWNFIKGLYKKFRL